MHPEFVSDEPGDCPECGMALEPVVVLGAGVEDVYTCPMHPMCATPGPATARIAAWRSSR